MTFEEFTRKYNISLNQQQLDAVKSVENPTLLLAVPGSGKTTVLIARLGYMIYCLEINPKEILTVTYTVAATKDMKARFIKVFGSDYADNIEFRTINGICAKIIAAYGRKIGRKPFNLISDEGERSRIVNNIYIKEYQKYPDEMEVKQVLTLATYAKNMMLKPEEIQKLGEDNDLPDFADIFRLYNVTLKENLLMDYDDQMCYAYNLLKKCPDILLELQNRYKYICVDEAQDTSKIQHMIIEIIAKKEQKLFMVGDEDQSIYGFRAAYPEALLSFEKTYTNAKVLLMEENFRSTKEIVETADAFIQKNRYRHKKTMNAHRSSGEKVEQIKAKSPREEYAILLNAAKNAKNQTAILYRDNECAVPVIDLLERNNIRYRIKGADFVFFSHKVVRDVIDIIDFIYNPNDIEVFGRIYYKLKTYITKQEFLKITQIVKSAGIDPLTAAIRLTDKEYKRKSLKDLKSDIRLVKDFKPSMGLNFIGAKLGYLDYMDRNKLSVNKFEIIKALSYNVSTLLELKTRIGELQTIIAQKEMDYDAKVILSTIHSSKGLEYDTVYLMDVKTGILPAENIKDYSNKEKADVYEEDRRLFYVGMTRAKNELNVFDFGYESPFVKEIFEKSSANSKNVKKHNEKTTAPYTVAVQTNNNHINSVLYNSCKNEILRTKTLEHKIFGKGEVTEIDDDRLTVRFSDKTRKLSLNGIILSKNIILKK